MVSGQEEEHHNDGHQDCQTCGVHPKGLFYWKKIRDLDHLQLWITAACIVVASVSLKRERGSIGGLPYKRVSAKTMGMWPISHQMGYFPRTSRQWNIVFRNFSDEDEVSNFKRKLRCQFNVGMGVRISPGTLIIERVNMSVDISSKLGLSASQIGIFFHGHFWRDRKEERGGYLGWHMSHFFFTFHEN